MVARSHMPDPAHIRRKRLATPPFPAENECEFRSTLGCAQEEFFHSPLAIRHSIPHKQKIARKLRFDWDGVVRLGIEPVVDRMTHPSTKGEVVVHDGRAATIGENVVVLADERPERIGGISFDSGQGSRSIDVPERNLRVC